MLPLIEDKILGMPSEEVLAANNAEVEHWLEGSEGRVKVLEQRVRADWKSTAVGPISEVTWGLFLKEDAVGFRHRAWRRTKELCAFAQANGVKYEKWAYHVANVGDYVSQTAFELESKRITPNE